MSKRFFSILLALLLALSLVPVSASAQGEAWMEFYVSPTGNDNGSGTQSSPFQTLERARDEVRKYNKNMQGDIVVNMLPGRYELSDYLEFEVEDSGSNGFDVIWQGTDPDNLPIISGAKEVTGEWTEGENGIWHVKAENLTFARDLFVNGVQATRAKTAKKIYGTGIYKDPNYHEDFNPETGKYEVLEQGMYIEKSKLGLFENPEDIEFFWEHQFRTTVFHVDDIIEDPKNENQVIAIMDRTHWGMFRATHAQSTITSASFEQYGYYASGFTVENAYELLDEPGEFYFNKKTKVLSYIPREGEDLNSAEVLCPQIDRLTFIHGGNYHNRVHNIAFYNVCFAHTSDLFLERANLFGAQGEYHYTSYTYPNHPFGSNVVDWAENLTFNSCVFQGLGAVGLQFRNGVYKSEVVGNVFADIGATGFAAGALNHRWYNEPPKEQTGPVNALWNAPWLTSYQHRYTCLVGGDENNVVAQKAWYSEPWAEAEGTYPYVKLQMDDYLRLESFEFSFPADATEEQRSNFEVILSKDIDLKDSKVIATFTEPADFKETIEIGDGEAWRYITLRKTVSGPFCLNSVGAWTNDLMPQGNIGAPADCVIANNYFTRVGLEKRSTYAICILYTENFEVVHNEIFDVPYTGISVGWGWDWAKSITSKNNTISFNKMVDNQTVASDGGGIYIFGEQPGTVMEGNYVRNLSGMAYALYFDAGAAGITAFDNVLMHGGRNIALAELTYDNKIWNTYSSDYPTAFIDPRANYELEETKMFSYSDRPDEVARIEAEAGLTDEWLWIKERTPQMRTVREHLLGMDAWESTMYKGANGFKASEKRKEEVPVMADFIIKNGDFGELPWEFEPAYKVELSYGVAAMQNNTNRTDDVGGGHQEEMVNLDTAVKNALDSVYHPSYEEMISMCDDFAKKATTNEYPKTAIDTFKKDVEAVKKTNPQTRGDKGVAANKLEKIYTALYNANLYPAITDVVVENAETVVDRANKKVTVQLPFGMEPEDANPTIFVTKNTKISKDVATIDFSSGKASIPLQHADNKNYAFWTVELACWNGEKEQGAVSVNPTDWVGGNMNVQMSTVNGALVIEPWWQPTMNANCMDGTYRFSLWMPRADTQDGIGLIFGAQTTDLEATYLEKKNTYYIANLLGDTLTLYRFDGGKGTAFATASRVYPEYGDFNDMEITVKAEGVYNRITIKMADKILIDTLVSEPIGTAGHFGILSKNMAIKIK